MHGTAVNTWKYTAVTRRTKRDLTQTKGVREGHCLFKLKIKGQMDLVKTLEEDSGEDTEAEERMGTGSEGAQAEEEAPAKAKRPEEVQGLQHK